MKDLNWVDANKWLDSSNDGKDDINEPTWGWDCNFKLDFDGPIISISSRFYPPHKNAGDWWEGTLSVLFLGNSILDKDFKCNTLDELRKEVEKFTKHYSGVIRSRISA